MMRQLILIIPFSFIFLLACNNSGKKEKPSAYIPINKTSDTIVSINGFYMDPSEINGTAYKQYYTDPTHGDTVSKNNKHE